MDEVNLPGIAFTGDIHIQGDMFNIHDNQSVTIVHSGELKREPAEDEELLNLIHIYFKDEDTAKRFLEQIQALRNDEARIDLVKRYRDNRLCLNTSKALWQALYDMGLYGKSYANWNCLMNRM